VYWGWIGRMERKRRRRRKEKIGVIRDGVGL
jgi:hypothetical protein